MGAEQWVFLGVLVTAIAGLATSAWTLLRQKKLDKVQEDVAEISAADKITEVALSLIEPLKRKVDELAKENTAMAARIDELEKCVGKLEKDNELMSGMGLRLEHQVESLGAIPTVRFSCIKDKSSVVVA